MIKRVNHQAAADTIRAMARRYDTLGETNAFSDAAGRAMIEMALIQRWLAFYEQAAAGYTDEPLIEEQAQ